MVRATAIIPGMVGGVSPTTTTTSTMEAMQAIGVVIMGITTTHTALRFQEDFMVATD
jgi:hypothetical protein